MEKTMNSRRANKARLLVLCVVALSMLLAGCQKSTFTGSSVANENEYLLDFEALNSVRSTELTLQEGDQILVSIDAAGGVLNLLVYPTGREDEPIYRADGASSGEFVLTVKEGGPHTFRVEGRDAKGAVHFTLKR